MANSKKTTARFGNIYSNPTFSQTNRDITNPALNKGTNIANRLGITYDLSEIEKIFKDAVEKGTTVNQELYDQANDKYYENIAAQSASLLDTMRKANAGAVNTGASRGVAAANELSAMLGMAQAGSEGALDLALQGYNLGDKANADTAQAVKDALETANQTGLQMGALDNEALMAWVQQYIAELQYQSELNALANAGGAGGYAGGGGGYAGGGSGGFPGYTGAAAGGAGGAGGIPTPQNGVNGRFTQGFVNATTQPTEMPIAIALGQMFDEYDRTGKVNEVTMQTLLSRNDPALVQAMYQKYVPVAQDVANGTELVDKTTGAWKPLETPIEPGDMKTVPNPAANPVYAAGTQGLVPPGQTLNTAPTYDVPAYQNISGKLVPPDVVTKVPAVDEAVDRLALQQAYDYAATKNGTKKYGDFVFGGGEEDYINPEWDEATKARVKKALSNAKMLKEDKALSTDGTFAQSQNWNIANTPATPVPPGAQMAPNLSAFNPALQTAPNAAVPNLSALNAMVPKEDDEDKKRKASPQVEQLAQLLRSAAAASAPTQPPFGAAPTSTSYSAASRSFGTPPVYGKTAKPVGTAPTRSGLANVLSTLSTAAKKAPSVQRPQSGASAPPKVDWLMQKQLSNFPTAPRQQNRPIQMPAMPPKPNNSNLAALQRFSNFPTAPGQRLPTMPFPTKPAKPAKKGSGNWKQDKMKDKL